MKLYIKFSSLSNTQRNQVISFHQEMIDDGKIKKHDLNQRRYQVDANSGNVIFHKDF